MNNDIDFKAREKFQERIIKNMLGPGSDIWGLPDEEEIISEFPLIRYFTGILFPEIDKVDSEFKKDIDEIENETSSNESIEENELGEDSEEVDRIDEHIDYIEQKQEDKEFDNIKISQNNFFPTNIALTVCVDELCENLNAEFSFGLYYQPSLEEVKIKISKEGYMSYFDEKIPFQLPFKDKLNYDGEFMYLSKPLDGFAGGKNKERSGDYKGFDDFKKISNLKLGEKYLQVYSYIKHLENLIMSRVWKRKNVIQKENIFLNKDTEPFYSKEFNDVYSKHFRAGYNVKTYTYQNKKYVKIQLINLSEKHPYNKFSNKNEKLNSKCMFQSKIKIISNKILPYKSQYEYFPFDEEAEKLNFLYRDMKNYAVGHNCSVNWHEDNKDFIETTFIPQSDVKNIKNDFEDKNNQKLNETLIIKNLSYFGMPKDKIIDNLKYFVSLYEEWISNQKDESKKLEEKNKEIANKIIESQLYNSERIKKNIELISKDENAFKAFQITNLTMFIQFIVSNDKNLGGKEKSLEEIDDIFPEITIDYFKTYKDDKNSAFKYRPFQLAFLLLSIDGIVNQNSKSRKEFVDLIWFPTGGGKTEAYLAVTAFTIIYRRLTNKINYEGTTVIMRYTLRLLTSQQFERASRLISILEFLRNQNEFSGFLKEEPISIGLWVGIASTPNKLKDAKEKLDEIERECNKDNNGDPNSKNVFQINACPLCGTKIISKDKNDIWKYGFNISNHDFKIFCINNNCFFHKKLPIQVIDEILYKKPPTLLFGTVDKFAMLAWQEEAYNFFNTQNDEKLPPDLIIQDELHLLNGPLGSIVGIFESVIELLCTKKGFSPKIIASTATTRNTDEQVKNLFGNRKTNIFPPSGINYNDSFFTNIDKSGSTRRYLGFMPTGKTAIDTQLQILANFLYARIEVFLEKKINKEIIDNYWTIVSYYNSLREVGKIFNKIGDEVKDFTRVIQDRFLPFMADDYEKYGFNYKELDSRTKELTSRIKSYKIKSVLKDIERKFEYINPKDNLNEKPNLNNVVDLVLATNMFSVGIDINRLNLMIINGMPKNIAEYIQVSSRIGRKIEGLALLLLDPNKTREKSYFEHFQSFHQSFYKNIEPLSVTPFTENTIKKMASTILVSFIRQMYPGELNKNDQAEFFEKNKISPLFVFIKKRYSAHVAEIKLFEEEINRLADNWVKRIKTVNLKKYDELIKKASEKEEDEDIWIVMQSMREVDTTTFIKIKEYS